jgi:peptidoglycan hydrolase-like protein with peptidoglycan-binding domain
MTDTIEAEPIEIERLGWNEALHPRQGGKFASKGGTTAGKKDSSEGLRFNGRTGAGYGSHKGDHRVHALQSELNRLHMTDASGKPLKLDGKLGPRTTAAIKKAQKALGLKPTGVATPALLARLKSSKGKLSKVVSKVAKKAAPAKKAKAAPMKKAAPAAKKFTGSPAAQKSQYLATVKK